MLKFRRKPVIKHLTTLSSLNEPFVQVVYPRPPWWQVCLGVLPRFVEVDLSVVSAWVQTGVKWVQSFPVASRRRVREA